jgi:hypothetical protein
MSCDTEDDVQHFFFLNSLCTDATCSATMDNKMEVNHYSLSIA